MASLDLIVLPNLRPAELLRLQKYFLNAVTSSLIDPILILHRCDGKIISLGSYHLFGCAPCDALEVTRRITGGRICGAGEGWFGISMILPDRSALIREKLPSRLKPEQVMNRYTRGLLTALRGMGLDCFYPGRDAITIGGRLAAMCCFETNQSAALLFEIFVAVRRGFELLPHELEVADPDGTLTCPMYNPEACTTLNRELGRVLNFDEFVDRVATSYSITLCPVTHRALTIAEQEASQAQNSAVAPSVVKALDYSPTHCLRTPVQIGFVEIYLMLDSQDSIRRVTFAGDLIANAGAMQELEQALQGQRLDLISVSKAVMRIFGSGDNFILGLGDLSNVAQLLVKAAQPAARLPR